MINKYKLFIMMNLNLEDLKELSKNNEVINKYMEELERVNNVDIDIISKSTNLSKEEILKLKGS